MNPSQQKRLAGRCTISRNPITGSTGITTIATDVPCTAVYPAGQQWNLDTATGYDFWELYLETTAVVKDGDVITLAARTYTTKRQKRWSASRVSLLLEERF